MKPPNVLATELLDGPLAYFDYIGSVEALTEAIEKDRQEAMKEMGAIIFRTDLTQQEREAMCGELSRATTPVSDDTQDGECQYCDEDGQVVDGGYMTCPVCGGTKTPQSENDPDRDTPNVTD